MVSLFDLARQRIASQGQPPQRGMPIGPPQAMPLPQVAPRPQMSPQQIAMFLQMLAMQDQRPQGMPVQGGPQGQWLPSMLAQQGPPRMPMQQGGPMMPRMLAQQPQGYPPMAPGMPMQQGPGGMDPQALYQLIQQLIASGGR